MAEGGVLLLGGEPPHTIFIRALCTVLQQNESVDVRIGSKADIGGRLGNVRFTPESGH
jgi:hypothetical protein